MASTQPPQQPLSHNGMAYFMRGFDLITTKGLKRFVIIPVLANLILFSLAVMWLVDRMTVWMQSIMDWLPGYFQWLEYLLWPLFVVVILLTFGLLFNTLTNWIAAPFNGLLAEKVERHLTGQTIDDAGLFDIVKDTPRTLAREFQKLLYFIPRSLGFFLLALLLPVVGQVIWLAWTAWMMAIQYLDYPFDNHKLPFGHMRQQLKQQRGKSFSFGAIVAVVTMVPLINFIVMPVAICGATALWVDHYREPSLRHKR
ncbi:MAG: sulfate transporter CysZ [Idiomarina sp.]